MVFNLMYKALMVTMAIINMAVYSILFIFEVKDKESVGVLFPIMFAIPVIVSIVLVIEIFI